MPGVLSQAEMQDFRFLVETLGMPTPFTITRETDVPDGAGGTTTTTVPVAGGDCRVRAGGLQPNERAIADRLGWTTSYAIELPYSTEITPSDRLVINGREMEIGGVVDTEDWATSKVAIVREIG